MEGLLYIEISVSEWREVYCVIKEKRFLVYDKVIASSPASTSNSGDLILELTLLPEQCDCKQISMSLTALSRLMKTNTLPESPFFFNIYITSENLTYHLATSSEVDRVKWIDAIRQLRKPEARAPKRWVRPNGILNQGNLSPNESLFTRENKRTSLRKDLKIKEKQISKEEVFENSEAKNEVDFAKLSTQLSQSKQESEDLKPNQFESNDQNENEEIDDEDEANRCLFCFSSNFRVCGVKVDTLQTLIRVVLAFPFIIVSSSLNFQSSTAILTSIGIIRFLNIMIYALPVILIRFVLSQFLTQTVERLTIGMYLLLFLAPVGYVAFNKVRLAASALKVEDGTFCFRPAMSVRWSQANAYAILGFLFEWLQHVLYVIPTGILTASKMSRISEFPPYLKFEVYFWICVGSSFACGLILVANSVLRGKLHYRFQKSELVWFFLYNISSPMYVTIITVLFMGLSCDYTLSPPTLFQDPSIVCYGDKHTFMARAGLIALAIYLIQNTLLPSGTFKETLRDPYLDIIFVPVYLQAHFLFKAIFCGVYVFFYQDNLARVIVLTIINLILLILNNYMKPCSVEWINVLRDLGFIHASLSGIQALNYLGWPINYSTKGMLLSTLVSNIIFSTLASSIYLNYTYRSTEFKIARAFLDLEWQVSREGSVHPRVLEPLISLTLSSVKETRDISKKYIGQLVFLITCENVRVQFQSAWSLANIALIDEESRMKIHEAGGTKILFDWYDRIESIAQLESLAALANLTLSTSLVVEDMVGQHNCIPFFINIIVKNKIRYSAQFAAIALANLSRKENFRDIIRRNRGIPALVSLVMSRDYEKRRAGCLALANMALSPSVEIEQAFNSSLLFDRIVKMAKRREIETQREVFALLRNLSCHAKIRPFLLDREIMSVLKVSKDTIYKDVIVWCDEIRTLMEREIVQNGDTTSSVLLRRDETFRSKLRGEVDYTLLDKMEPLSGQVDWSTWGSKLESIFAPVFVKIPTVQNGRYNVKKNQTIKIDLSAGISRSLMRSWRDNLTFSIVDIPLNGKLSTYNTNQDHTYYTPHTNFVGQDKFTYVLKFGSLESWKGHIILDVFDDNIASDVNDKIGSEFSSMSRVKEKKTSTGDYNSAPGHDLDNLEAGVRSDKYSSSLTQKQEVVRPASTKRGKRDVDKVELHNIYSPPKEAIGQESVISQVSPLAKPKSSRNAKKKTIT